jgi:hypothetical protein
MRVLNLVIIAFTVLCGVLTLQMNPILSVGILLVGLAVAVAYNGSGGRILRFVVVSGFGMVIIGFWYIFYMIRGAYDPNSPVTLEQVISFWAVVTVLVAASMTLYLKHKPTTET